MFKPPGLAPSCKASFPFVSLPRASFPVLTPRFVLFRLVLYRLATIIFLLPSRFRDRPSPLSSLPPLILDLIALDLISRQGTITSERDLVYRTLRATAYSTYHARCRLLTSLVLVSVSRFVLKRLDSGSGNAGSLGILFSSKPLCVPSSFRNLQDARSFPPPFSRSTSTLNASYRACQPRLLLSSLSISYLPYGLAGSSTPLRRHRRTEWRQDQEPQARPRRPRDVVQAWQGR